MVQKSGVHQLRLVVYPPVSYNVFLHPRWWLFGISSINSTWAVLLTSFSKAPTQPTTALARKTRSEIWIWSEWNLNQKAFSLWIGGGLKPSANQVAFVLACCWGLFLQKLRCPWTAQQQNWQIHHVSISLQGAAWYRTGVFFGLQRCFVYTESLLSKKFQLKMHKAALYFSQPSPLQLGSRHTDGGHRWRDGTLGPLRDIVEAGDQLGGGKERTLDSRWFWWGLSVSW